MAAGVAPLATALAEAADLLHRRATIDAELAHHTGRIAALEAEAADIDAKLAHHADTAKHLAALAKAAPKPDES